MITGNLSAPSQERDAAASTCDISDPNSFRDGVPHAALAAMRRAAPVQWVRQAALVRRDSRFEQRMRGAGYWAVLSYEAVVEVSKRPAIYSSAAQGAFLTDPGSRESLEQSRNLLINMDDPQHATLRRFVSRAFLPRAMNELRASIERHARALVEQAVQRVEFDAVRDLCAELPLLVLADLLGVPPEDRGLMFKWSNNIVGFDDPEYGGGDVEIYRGAFAEMFLYTRDLLAQKRRAGAEDLLSTLVRLEVDGHQLSEQELCNLCVLLMIGGNESTRHLLSGSLDTLLDNPDSARELEDGDLLLPTAVDELLRWVSPVMQFRRTALEDAVLCDQTIHAGDKVVLYYGVANRDETMFPRSECLVLGRKPNPHVAFGTGPHFCLGAHLARLEAMALLGAMRPHLAHLQRTAPGVHLLSNFMNGMKSMPARLSG